MFRLSLIDRYLLKRVVWPFAAGMLIGMTALLLQQMIRLLDLSINRGSPATLVLKMLGNLVPHYLSIAIPAAFFIAILYATLRMSNDSELDAIRGSGISLRRLAAPIMLMAVLLAVTSAIILGVVQPYSRYAYRALVYLVTETSWNAAIERGAFFHGFGGKTILIGDIADSGRTLSRIFIHETDIEGNDVILTAEKGELAANPWTLSRMLILRDGIRVDSRPDGTRGRVSTFDESKLPLEVVAPEPFRPRGSKHSELSLWELIHAYQHPTPSLRREEVSSEINYRIAYTLTVLFLPLIAIPMGLASHGGRNGIRFAVGIAVLIIYNQTLQFGQNMVEGGFVSAFVAIWIPFLIFALGSTHLFYVADSELNRDPLAVAFRSIEGAWNWIKVRSVALLKWGALYR
jgi:lipopolysaccharide export system permease protein